LGQVIKYIYTETIKKDRTENCGNIFENKNKRKIAHKDTKTQKIPGYFQTENYI
jgi:hypothetical protein